MPAQLVDSLYLFIGVCSLPLQLQRGSPLSTVLLLAAACFADYDLDGAQGVGSAGGLAIARYLLQARGPPAARCCSALLVAAHC